MTHVVTILKLRQILRKMLPTDMDMRAVDPALEHGPEAFDGLDVRAGCGDVFARIVIAGVVPVAVLPERIK